MRVALYLRRSTNEELQADSLEYQEEILRSFAAQRGLAVVRVFRESASGRDAQGREVFSNLIRLVTSGRAAFDGILVRDVSRWGRFQDTDESAYYEFLCFRHGVEVIYAEEDFGSDRSPYAALQKTMKRVLAAEFSREKSRIVTYGKRRTAERGFRTGAPAPYGMQRVMVKPDGSVVGFLRAGEHKAISAYKTTLAPATDASADVVRQIFALFLDGLRCAEIVRLLNAQGVRGPRGGQWHQPTVKQILTCAAYAGVAVHRPWQTADAERPAIRVEGAHEPLIDGEVFRRAQERFRESTRRAHLCERQRAVLMRDAAKKWGHLPASLLEQLTTAPRPLSEEALEDALAGHVADVRRGVRNTLSARFDVDERGSHLLIDGALRVGIIIGWIRHDLVKHPVTFNLKSIADVDFLVCIGAAYEDGLRIVLRCTARPDAVRGKHLLRHQDARSDLLPLVASDAQLISRVKRALRTGAVAEACLQRAAAHYQRTTISALARDLGWSRTTTQRTIARLEDRGEPLPELRRTRVHFTCPDCGTQRDLRASDRVPRRCAACAQAARAQRKLEAVCPACGAARLVWPSTARKMVDGLASLCHDCALAKGRALTRERNHVERAAREEKYAFLHEVALLVVKAMHRRTAEFERPVLWRRERRRHPTFRWRTPHTSVHQRLSLDCTRDFLLRARTMPREEHEQASLAEAILDRAAWRGGEKTSEGERSWSVLLT